MSGLFGQRQSSSAGSATGGFDRAGNPVAPASTVAPTIAAPVVTPVATMPDDSSPEVREANRRAQQAAMTRAGRSSTILSSPGGRGNSRQSIDSYGSRTLGGG